LRIGLRRVPVPDQRPRRKICIGVEAGKRGVRTSRRCPPPSTSAAQIGFFLRRSVSVMTAGVEGWCKLGPPRISNLETTLVGKQRSGKGGRRWIRLPLQCRSLREFCRVLPRAHVRRRSMPPQAGAGRRKLSQRNPSNLIGAQVCVPSTWAGTSRRDRSRNRRAILRSASSKLLPDCSTLPSAVNSSHSPA